MFIFFLEKTWVKHDNIIITSILIKMKKQKYHTVGTVLKSNRTKYLKNVISIPNMLTIKHY